MMMNCLKVTVDLIKSIKRLNLDRRLSLLKKIMMTAINCCEMRGIFFVTFTTS